MKYYINYQTRAKNAKTHRHTEFGRTVYFETIDDAKHAIRFLNVKYDAEIRTTKHETVARRVKGEWLNA